MVDAYLLSAVRTPIGKFLGDLAELSAPALGAVVIADALKRARASVDHVEEVIFGQVLQAGVGQNPARQAAIKAGLRESVAAVTVNKVCGSGLKAVMLAAQAIRAGDAELLVAGGMESMSSAPHLVYGRRGWRMGDQTITDSMVHDGLWCAFEYWHMGEAADHIATKCGVTRQEQDRYAAMSQFRAKTAWDQEVFETEVVPVSVGTGAKAKLVTHDEGMRPETTVEALAKLKPVFRGEGTVTAGNSSMLADGAAALVVGTAKMAEKLGVKPMGKIVAYATSGVAPKEIFSAPVTAIKQVLQKAKLTLADIDLIELNEAFAAQVLGNCKELGLEVVKLNVHGGAIALGHPIGASGARVLVSLAHAMTWRGAKRGLAALCLGGGNAVAMVIEKV